MLYSAVAALAKESESFITLDSKICRDDFLIFHQRLQLRNHLLYYVSQGIVLKIRCFFLEVHASISMAYDSKSWILQEKSIYLDLRSPRLRRI